MAHIGETNLDHLDFELSRQDWLEDNDPRNEDMDMSPQEREAYEKWIENQAAIQITIEARAQKQLEEVGF